MAIGFISFGTVTVADAADPNASAPSAARIISAPNRQQDKDFPSRLTLGAHFVAGGANSVDVDLWVKDNSDPTSARWFQIASLTTINDVAQVVVNIPPNAELFAEVTAIAGAPTNATVVGHFH